MTCIYPECNCNARNPHYCAAAKWGFSKTEPSKGTDMTHPDTLQIPRAVVEQDNYDMSIHSNPDAQAWAKFFIKTQAETGFTIDEALMIGWFANAMMAMHDYLKQSKASTIEEIRGAVARGWCTPENSHKEMDTTLASAIADSVQASLQSQPTPPVGHAAAEPVAEECGMCKWINEARDNLHPSYTEQRMNGPGHTCGRGSSLPRTTPQPTPDAEAILLALDTLRGLLCVLTGDEYADAKAAIAALEKVKGPAP